MKGGGPPLDWRALAPLIEHETRESIFEALRRIGEPLSAPDLKRVIDNPEFRLPYIQYHVSTLAQTGLLVECGQRPNGAASVEILYLLRWPECP